LHSAISSITPLPMAAASVQRRDLRLPTTAVLAAVTLLSAKLYCTEVERATASVWWFGWVTALSTGLGALPVAVCKNQLSSTWLGLSNAVAAGMMTAASWALFEEGSALKGASEVLTPLQAVVLGGLLGVGFVALSQHLFDGCGDAKLGILEDAVDTRRALLIVLVMTVHSFSEGIGIGASFGGMTGNELGMLVTTTLAVHNVPEGFAISTVLVSKGMSPWGASLWSIFTSIPQPLMAIAAYSCVDAFVIIQPIGLGFAAGAMLWVAWLELFVESYEACGLLSTSAVGVTSASLMSVCHAYLIA